MVTRSRSDKGSFVQSPKGAFDSGVSVCEEWIGDWSGPVFVNRYWSRLVAGCLFNDNDNIAGVGSRRGVISVRMVDNQPFNPEVAMNFRYSRDGIDWGPQDQIAASANECLQSNSIRAFYGGAESPGSAGYTIYENHMQKGWTEGTPLVTAADLIIPIAQDLGFSNSNVPQWDVGPGIPSEIDVIACPT